jgi:hypothetical protein
MSDYAKMLASRAANPLEDAEFVAMAEEREREYRLTSMLDHELGLDEPEIGRDIHTNALKILAARGLADKYTDEQYLDACKRAGAR